MSKEREKVKCKTELEFISEVADDCVANLKNKDREYLISNIADVANTASVIKNFVERQGDLLVGGIVLRKFENLKHIGFHERSGMPISDEYRVFVYARKVLIMDN